MPIAKRLRSSAELEPSDVSSDSDELTDSDVDMEGNEQYIPPPAPVCSFCLPHGNTFTCFQGSRYYDEKASSSNKAHAKKRAVS